MNNFIFIRMTFVIPTGPRPKFDDDFVRDKWTIMADNELLDNLEEVFSQAYDRVKYAVENRFNDYKRNMLKSAINRFKNADEYDNEPAIHKVLKTINSNYIAKYT
jgi:hypothetical protein